MSGNRDEIYPDKDQDLATFLRGIAAGLGICILFALLCLSFYLHGYFHLANETMLEALQSVMLLLTIGMGARLVLLLPLERGGLLVITSLFVCMLIREHDFLLNTKSFPGWEILVLAVLLLLAWQVRKLGAKSTLGGLASFIRSGACPLMLCGLGVLLVFSRLFGWSGLWVFFTDSREELVRVKRMAEECTETLGYALIMLAMLCYYLNRRREVLNERRNEQASPEEDIEQARRMN